MTTTPEPPAISTDSLTRRFGARAAVDGVTLSVPRGAVAGLVGPNGAGKTTLMAMLLGLVHPTSGSARVAGRDPVRRDGGTPPVGALIEAPAFHPGLTATQNLAYLARLGGHRVDRVPQLLDLVGLAGRHRDRYRTYSLGMKQRLGIASALLGDPEVVVLDEPANGVDPAGMRDIRAILEQIAAQGRTLLVSSHLLAELEQVCTWLVVLERGRLLFHGAPDALVAPHERLVVRSAEPGAEPDLVRALSGLGPAVSVDDGAVVLALDGLDSREMGAAANRAAHAAGLTLAEIRRERPDLLSGYLGLLETRAAA